MNKFTNKDLGYMEIASGEDLNRVDCEPLDEESLNYLQERYGEDVFWKIKEYLLNGLNDSFDNNNEGEWDVTILLKNIQFLYNQSMKP